jgi:GAF domain-containing protein
MSHHAAFAVPRVFQDLSARFDAARLQDDVTAVVRAAARGALGADGVTFVLRDGDFCHYVEEDAIGPLWKGKKFPMASCISGWAMLNDQTAAISDIYMDKRVPHDAYRPTFVRSLIMAPIRVDGPVAAIGAYWQTRRSFTPDDIKAVEMMADFAGNALRRVRSKAA